MVLGINLAHYGLSESSVFIKKNMSVLALSECSLFLDEVKSRLDESGGAGYSFFPDLIDDGLVFDASKDLWVVLEMVGGSEKRVSCFFSLYDAVDFFLMKLGSSRSKLFSG